MATHTKKTATGDTARRTKARGPAQRRLERELRLRDKRPHPESAEPQIQEQEPYGEPMREPLVPAALPEILAPAGDMPAALAALAAGADALYLGLKHFSARMQAENFATRDLAALADLAHAEGRRIYVAMNTLVKPGEPPQAYRLIRRLAEAVRPDALIVQDLAMLDLARQAGFQGELHLSTLANVTHQSALTAAQELGVSRVILPRESTLDEIRMMDAACPEGLDLELFVHGALCYCVSGRCWWSSYMGGKSGLRGRCVQPCRRVYTQKSRSGRFFSCLDLALAGNTRELLALSKIRSWKIEGRKKGPHYVANVTRAYKLFRDNPDSTEARAEARELLQTALGRPSTQSLFMGHDIQGVTAATLGKDAQTSSGLLCGRVRKDEEGGYSMQTRVALMPKDFLRIGYEDEQWHCTLSVQRGVEAQSFYKLGMPRGKHPKPGTPVFLIDRKERELMAGIQAWSDKLHARSRRSYSAVDVAGLEPSLPAPLAAAGARRPLDVMLRASLPHGRDAKSGIKPGVVQGLWLSHKGLKEVSRTLYDRISWWLPPVVWPEEDEAFVQLVHRAVLGGARHFVCNSPWQAALFQGQKGVSLTAGPFCNTANAPALGLLAKMGFQSAIVSTELGSEDLLALPGQSPLPLGIVLDGFWPVGITRHKASPLKAQDGFSSPKGEEFWMRRYGQNIWLYPAWPLDLSAHRSALERAGYTTFIHMQEYPPKTLTQAERPGEFNWNGDVL